MLIPLRIMAERLGMAVYDARSRGLEATSARIFASDSQIKSWGAEAAKANILIKNTATKPVTFVAIMGVPIITTQVDTPYIGWPANS